MALRTPLTLAARRATSTGPATPAFSAYSSQWRRSNATVAPVAQKTGADGQGTAIVFMNMGGPSKTDEVHSFLSRLFVRIAPQSNNTTQHTLILTVGR
jgi:ferrochelatase